MSGEDDRGEKLAKMLHDLVAEHAKYDPRVAEAAVSADSTNESEALPLYVQDLRARAERDGVTVDQIRMNDRAYLADHRYPSAECLKPSEIMAAVGGERLSTPTTHRHLDECRYCIALVATAAARLDGKSITEMARHLAAAAAPIASATIATNSVDPAVDGLPQFWTAATAKIQSGFAKLVKTTAGAYGIAERLLPAAALLGIVIVGVSSSIRLRVYDAIVSVMQNDNAVGPMDRRILASYNKGFSDNPNEVQNALAYWALIPNELGGLAPNGALPGSLPSACWNQPIMTGVFPSIGAGPGGLHLAHTSPPLILGDGYQNAIGLPPSDRTRPGGSIGTFDADVSDSPAYKASASPADASPAAPPAK